MIVADHFGSNAMMAFVRAAAASTRERAIKQFATVRRRTTEVGRHRTTDRGSPSGWLASTAAAKMKRCCSGNPTLFTLAALAFPNSAYRTLGTALADVAQRRLGSPAPWSSPCALPTQR